MSEKYHKVIDEYLTFLYNLFGQKNNICLNLGEYNHAR